MAGRVRSVLILLLCASTAALAKGRVLGRVVDAAGEVLPGVEVTLDATEAIRVTDRDGSFFFARVREGIHSLTLRLGEHTTIVSDLEVASGETATVEVRVDWGPSFAEQITVAASRRVERAVDAPASVVTLSGDAIARESGSGNIPRFLEAASGVQVVNPSGFIYEVNARGFNGFNNRRVQVFPDGVDQSVPFAGFQEWFPRNLTDLDSVEFVKGAASPLYGPDAFNGVVNLTTRRPADSQGGTVRLSVGEPHFLRADLRWAGSLRGDWYFKLVGSLQEGQYFAQSRNETIEYPGLPMELLSLPADKTSSGTYSTRADWQAGAGSLLTLEAGFQKLSGAALAIAFPGRFALVEPIEQSWLRADYSSPHFEVLAHATDRQAPDFVDLTTTAHFFDDSQRRRVQALWRDDFGSLRVVSGTSYEEDDIGHAVLAKPQEGEAKALFGQVDYDASADLRIVLAARWDEGTLYDGRVSPKAGLVWAVHPRHTLRATYSEAFQTPTYGDYFLDLPFFLPTPGGPVPAVDLSPIETSLCAPVGLPCGFATPTGARLVGNRGLAAEETTGVDIGYGAILGERVFLNIDYYRNEVENFISQPLLDPFGTFNKRFSPYQPPAAHPDPDAVSAALQGALGPLYAFLLQEADGTPLFVPLGFTNAGRVDTQGVDLSLSAILDSEWFVDFGYSWFDFEVQHAGAGGAIFPNTPEHAISLVATWSRSKLDVTGGFRWVDDTFWSSGVFVGPVPSYGLVTAGVNYSFNESWSLGLDVNNVLDNEHYQAFGGDLLGRRTVLFMTFDW
jgi:outer membrane receptor protein involved in Fe transport